MSVRACVRPLKFRLTFFKLLLFEQVRFNYNQTWIIGALWEPSHYDALGGHMTRSKFIWGQIIRSSVRPSVKVSVNLLQIAPVRTGSLQWCPNLDHRCTMGTFTLWRTWRSHDKVKGHLRSIVIVISVNLFQIAPVRTGSLQLQSNLVHRCTMGTFSLWRSSRSHDKVKGHWRSFCYSYFS